MCGLSQTAESGDENSATWQADRAAVCAWTRPPASRVPSQYPGITPFLQHGLEEMRMDRGAYSICSEKLKTNAFPASFAPSGGRGGQEMRIRSPRWVQPELHCLHINYSKTRLAAPPTPCARLKGCKLSQSHHTAQGRSSRLTAQPRELEAKANSNAFWKEKQARPLLRESFGPLSKTLPSPSL